MFNIKFVLLGVALMSTFAYSAFKAPEFCNGLECPEFELISSPTKTIEIRQYKKSSWVSTDMKNGSSGALRSKAFWTLFNYISGENENKEKIEMTAPVLVKYNLMNSKNPSFDNNLFGTMSFYLGYKYENKAAPQPNDPNAYLFTLEPKKYAVISYGGYSNEQDQEENLRILGSYLEQNNLKYVKDSYFYAGYDSPFKFLTRHNEVWVELY